MGKKGGECRGLGGGEGVRLEEALPEEPKECCWEFKPSEEEVDIFCER